MIDYYTVDQLKIVNLHQHITPHNHLQWLIWSTVNGIKNTMFLHADEIVYYLVFTKKRNKTVAAYCTKRNNFCFTPRLELVSVIIFVVIPQ